MRVRIQVWLVLALCGTCLGQWAVPDPWLVDHPGSEMASPRSYPDREGFQQRCEIILKGLAQGGLDKWRRGYFKGGDPGKYLPGHAMAKLLLNPENPEPALYMNDERSYKEHYHFATVNWSRFLPIFGQRVLTAETLRKLSDAGFTHGSYRDPRGTENHRVMWWTSANVLPHYLVGKQGLAHQSKEATLATAKQQLFDYVKGLYTAGQGEWDSSTYLMFDLNGLLNIYDFSPDPESRLLAKAALDYLVAAYALKYTDGVYCAPNQRGFTKGPHTSITDQTGYLWWGSHAELTPEDTGDFRYAIHAATSSWRPNAVICNIARRALKRLPVEQRNSKANYWHGQRIAPQPGATHESLYIDEHFTMGSSWDGHGSQHTRFMIAIASDDGAVVITGGHPRRSDHTGKKIGIGFRDGTGRYVQSVQVGPTYLCMAQAPEGEEHDYCYVTIPAGVTAQRSGAWHTLTVEETLVAVRPLAGQAEVSQTPADKKGGAVPILKFSGRRSGFLVWVGSPAIGSQLSSVALDSSAYLAKGAIQYHVPRGPEVRATFNPAPEGKAHGSRAARVSIDGNVLDLASWDIYGGPYLQQKDRVVTVSDGRAQFTIDFTGDLPVYR